MSVFTSSGGQTSISGDISIVGAANPTITNVDMLVGGTEYSYVLPTGTKKFQIRTRGGSKLQVAYIPGDTATTYITVPRFCFYSESELSTTSLTVYFVSTENNEIAEIVSWV